MEKYVSKVKSALNNAIRLTLLKKDSIKLISGYTVNEYEIGMVSVIDLTELKLLDFVAGRKFEVDGNGTFSVADKISEEKTKFVAFTIKHGIVVYNDLKQEFDVTDIGEFVILDWVR